MLTYTHTLIGDVWHVAYFSDVVPLTSVRPGGSEQDARKEAARLNEQAAKEAKASIVTPHDQRKLVPGFYTDEDAA